MLSSPEMTQEQRTERPINALIEKCKFNAIEVTDVDVMIVGASPWYEIVA
ncbi:hypothetical protein [Rhizobium leguminosarum]|nr:hypothetical protein [Rhizobium leguminosarum]MBY5554136.1 hypothetical protein [Rhizobium leguminosarum]MBY5723562.1 hypothetical protein [Rhizobium leguminosarum]QSW27255.1 hypothetical protein J0664_30995 [Rhizobium leguminosarum]